MRYSKYILMIGFLFSFYTGFADTFVVRSNADSGAGTLRDALTKAAANGIFDKDFITFDLPGNNLADVTIRLRTALPVVTSNISIDGSTQAGQRLGVSGAKVILEPEFANPTFSCLVIGSTNVTSTSTTDVEIYGLYIRKFATITSLQNVNTNQGSGIVLDYGVQNVTIGKPGKGNVICGNLYGILMRNYYYTTAQTLSNISIQSNHIGVMDDGYSEMTNMTGIAAELTQNTLTIGGDTEAEGNIIAANGVDITVNRTYSTSFAVSLSILNNKIGTDYTGKKSYKTLPIFSGSSTIEMSGIKINASNTTVTVHKNIISGHLKWGLTIASADFLITGNHIGTGISGTETDLGNDGGIRIETNAQGTIGGTALSDGNLIGYNRFGIETISSRSLKITRNSIFCNSAFGIGKTTTATQAFVQLLKINSGYVSGKASPNSEVEIFYTDNCPGKCQGKTYIGTERAGNDGRWIYTGAITGNVTATASIPNGVTSPFSTAALLPNEAVVDPVTCNGRGKVTIAEPREGMTFTWYRLEGDQPVGGPIGSSQSITGLEVGTYRLMINDGCQVVSENFAITDQILTKPSITVPAAACGQTSFAFQASTLRGKGTLRYQWMKDGVVVASSAQANLPEGTYTVIVSDDAGCTKESDPVTRNVRPVPRIITTGMVNTGAACGDVNGSIVGIQIGTPTGVLSYKWNVVNTLTGVIGAEVQQTLDLTGVAGGRYRLTVTDASDCSPVTMDFNINIYNSVLFSGGSITRTTCNTNNGAIKGVMVAAADYYEWRNNTGQVLESGPYSPGQVLNLTDRAAGTYFLFAKNTISGCNNLSQAYQIDQISPTQYLLSPQVVAATCGLNNGSVTLNYTSVSPVTYQWRDAAGNPVPGTDRELKGLASGTYRFFAYDINRCETVFGPYTIDNTPILTVQPGSGFTVNDGCSLLRGAISGIRISGGILPYTFTWKNDLGETIKSNQSGSDLTGVPEGRYQLTVKDNTSCGEAQSQYFTIGNVPFEIQKPVINDLRVCYATEIMLPVLAPEAVTYQLFLLENDSRPVAETTNGRFIFKVGKSADYFVRTKNGTCFSNFTKVHVEVTNDNIDIKNTMTPNGDGMNDLWFINGLPESGNVNIKLYTRSGQLVYESMGKYEKPFDGYFRGKELPAGVYYYRIDLRADCSPIAGSLTLLR